MRPTPNRRIALGVVVTLLAYLTPACGKMGIDSPTAVIGRDFETLGHQYNRTIAGNFIEQEMPFLPRNSTVVTIFAGGNEVNTITAALAAGAGAADQPGFVDAEVRAFGADYAIL